MDQKSKSGFPGVRYEKFYKCFISRIRINGRRYKLGYFSTAEDASLAYYIVRNRLTHYLPPNNLSWYKSPKGFLEQISSQNKDIILNYIKHGLRR